jgi:hypothetical protein
MKRIGGGKERLVAMLDLVRTELCFLLFEELDQSDAWLQCLEVRVRRMFAAPVFL